MPRMRGDIKRIVAENVRRLRLERELSQEAVAYKAGVSVGHVSAVELGKTSATITVIAQLAHALDVEPAELLRSLPPTRKR
jgi:transcriptional regulator with XRE-family HTH domain